MVHFYVGPTLEQSLVGWYRRGLFAHAVYDVTLFTIHRYTLPHMDWWVDCITVPDACLVVLTAQTPRNLLPLDLAVMLLDKDTRLLPFARRDNPFIAT